MATREYEAASSRHSKNAQPGKGKIPDAQSCIRALPATNEANMQNISQEIYNVNTSRTSKVATRMNTTLSQTIHTP
jgi:hypothetical protein